jgi:hypothetical protein
MPTWATRPQKIFQTLSPHLVCSLNHHAASTGLAFVYCLWWIVSAVCGLFEADPNKTFSLLSGISQILNRFSMARATFWEDALWSRPVGICLCWSLPGIKLHYTKLYRKQFELTTNALQLCLYRIFTQLGTVKMVCSRADLGCFTLTGWSI